MSLLDTPAALLQMAVQHHAQGRLSEAMSAYRQILAQEPRHVDALHLLGVALSQSGQAAGGAALIRESLAINDRQASAWSNLGNAELAQSRAEEALRCHERAISLAPGHVLAHNGRGKTLMALARDEEALASFDRVLAIEPGFFQAIANRGLANFRLGRYADAAADGESALKINPMSPETRRLRCASLLALEAFAQVLQEARSGLAGRRDDAELEYYAGTALLSLGRESEALAAYERALQLRPEFPDALFDLGTLCLRLSRFARATAAFDELVALAPDKDYARGTRLYARLQICDWHQYEDEVRAVIGAVEAGIRADLPLSFMTICDDPSLQLKCTQLFAVRHAKPLAASSAGQCRPTGRLRVAYVSADFVEHPVAHLLCGVIDAHDREQFETIAISLRADERSPTQQRLRLAFDRFIDATGWSDAAIAALIRELEVEVAIDLMGYTAATRPGVFARRPAPIQVNYLGYPGTLCASYIEYLIADAVVIPPSDFRFYSEQVVHLPNCYLPNDVKRKIGVPPTRAQAGLPEHGLVLCAMTTPYKLNPPLFDVWARILRETPPSVLWVRATTDEARTNLRRELERRAVDRERLVFAAHVPEVADHLARLALADLCLDTFPYNSHSTACDALWAGVPVLTCAGRGMASRVAASTLRAVGLGGELITVDLSEYEARAIALASHPDRLRELKETLCANRGRSALFDTATYTRALEHAFLEMRRQRLGL